VYVATRWCELEVLPNRSQYAVEEALEREGAAALPPAGDRFGQ